MSFLLRKAEEVAGGAQSVVQHFNESAMEKKTRTHCKFHETEAKLPNIKIEPVGDGRNTLSNDLLSNLGKWNPLPSEISSDDTVWLLDNTAYRNPKTKKWEAEFVAAVFDKNTGVEVSTVVADLVEHLGIAKGDAQEAVIRQRLLLFMQNILPGRKVHVTFGQKAELTLGPGGRHAISSDIETLPDDFKEGEIVQTQALVPQGANGVLHMNTFFAEPEGWAVISDIDDTIKITQTGDPIGILRSTFISEPTPVAGMPELYTFMQRLLSQKTAWFYLSASPYNLYPFLSDFRQRYFPQGTMILRDASWMNLAGLLSNLTLGTQQYKVDRMKKIHSWLPSKKLILIGDSTQSDPESYGEIYRENKNWVRLILIRRVTDIAAIGIEEKNEPDRFKNAFKGVPEGVWHVFENPEECYPIISDVVKKESTKA